MKINNKIIFLIFILIFSLLVSCSENTNISSGESNYTIIDPNDLIQKEDVEISLEDSDIVYINLNSDSIKSSWEWVDIDWNIITIQEWWNYNFIWNLEEWEIIVDSDDKKTVNLILNWVDIYNPESSAIFVKSAKQTVITLADNTKNYLSDSNNYKFSNSKKKEPSATIFSKDQLIIMWEGSLNIDANYKTWIASNDELIIKSWTIKINSEKSWIIGKDYLLIDGWNITINSEWDWIKSNNEGKWYLIINDWNISINSSDDAIHSEVLLEINGWNITVTNSYESLESNYIVINGWNLDLISVDDWLNADWWDWEPRTWENSWDYGIYINWWIINIDASWDWIDANGSIVITGWETYVNWPTSNDNGPLDYDGYLLISWGKLIASWSSAMAENISDSSSYFGILLYLDAYYDAWTKISLQDSLWNEIISFVPTKKFSSIMFSSSDIKNWEILTSFIWEKEYKTFQITEIATTIGL